MADRECFLITGAMGCIGAWLVRRLVDEQVDLVATDVHRDTSRLRLLLTEDEMARVQIESLDVLDPIQIRALISQHAVTHVIHLAGLQVPACRSNPALGAQVNVVGTIQLLEAVRQSGERVRGLSYASSIAVLGRPECYGPGPVGDDAPCLPETLYGVYKVADELAARVYFHDYGLGSVGLRPYIVYGPGRDQGLTSDLTKATLAAAARQEFKIKFSGPVAVHYAPDIADLFIRAARCSASGNAVCNIAGEATTVEEFVQTLRDLSGFGGVSHESDKPLPFPWNLDQSRLESLLGPVRTTPLREAVRGTLAQFRRLLDEGRIDLKQLG
jgi:nucleoside-diphosphate-sugar epimerase